MLLGEPGTWNLIDRAFFWPAQTSLHFFSELPVFGLTVAGCPLVRLTPHAMLNNVLDHILIFILFLRFYFYSSKIQHI